MRSRKLTLVCLPAFVLIGVVCVCPEWVQRAGLDVWNGSSDRECLCEANCRGRDLETEREAIRHRIEASQQIIAAVASGNSNLAEAVAAMTRVAQQHPEWLAAMTAAYRAQQRVAPTATEQDILATYLVLGVETHQWDAAARGDSTTAAALAQRVAQLTREIRVVHATRGVPTARRFSAPIVFLP